MPHCFFGSSYCGHCVILQQYCGSFQHYWFIYSIWCLFKLTWSMQKWFLVFSPNICCANHENLTEWFEAEVFSDLPERTVMAAVVISVLLHDMQVNSKLDDFLNYALCTTREHQRTLKRIKDLHALLLAELSLYLKIFEQGLIGNLNSLYGYIKTNGGSYKFTVISVSRNNRQWLTGELLIRLFIIGWWWRGLVYPEEVWWELWRHVFQIFELRNTERNVTLLSSMCHKTLLNLKPHTESVRCWSCREGVKNNSMKQPLSKEYSAPI